MNTGDVSFRSFLSDEDTPLMIKNGVRIEI